MRILDWLIIIVILVVSLFAIGMAFDALEHEITWWYIPIIAGIIAVIYNFTVKKWLMKRYLEQERENPKLHAWIYAFNMYVGLATVIIIFIMMVSASFFV